MTQPEGNLPAKTIYAKKEEIAEPVALTTAQMLELRPEDVQRNVVLAYIANIDDGIAALDRDRKTLNGLREKLMKRVISEDINEDAFAYTVKIPGKLYRNPIAGANVERFRNEFPVEYAAIRLAQMADIDTKHEEAIVALPQSEIPLGDADKLVGKERVSAFTGYKPQSVAIEVRKKPAMRLR